MLEKETPLLGDRRPLQLDLVLSPIQHSVALPNRATESRHPVQEFHLTGSEQDCRVWRLDIYRVLPDANVSIA